MKRINFIIKKGLAEKEVLVKIRNHDPTYVINANRNMKLVNVSRLTRVCTLCWLLLIILFKISKTPLRPIIMPPGNIVTFFQWIEDLFSLTYRVTERKKNRHDQACKFDRNVLSVE